MWVEQASYETRIETAARKAEENGFEAVWPEPSHLLLDLDEQDFFFHTAMPILQETFGAEIVRHWVSKSGRGMHFVVDMKRNLTTPERIALQAACGSDRKRELLAMNNWFRGVQEPSVLFKPKEKK